MKKKRIRFNEVKTGKYFKFYSKVYRKYSYHDAVQLVGKPCYSRFFIGDDKVIPVTVTIKVKEK